MNNYHVADDGFAVWVIPSDQQCNNIPEVDIHINQWVVNTDKKHEIAAYMDFGIRVNSAKKADKVCFYTPFHIDKKDFEDLSMLLKDEMIARGIFNTICYINIDDENNMIELMYNNHDCNVTTLEKEIKTYFDGCDGMVIEFDVSSILSKLTKDELYIRFRLLNKGLKNFLSQNSSKFKSLVTILSSPILREDYLYTVRVNEMRSLPSKIRDNDILKEQKIKKIILTVCVNQPYVVDSSTCYKTRILENELYKDYVPKGFLLDGCIVNQWLQEKTSYNHYNLTCIYNKEEVNKISLVLYLFIVVILSALGGGVVELIKYILGFNK